VLSEKKEFVVFDLGIVLPSDSTIACQTPEGSLRTGVYALIDDIPKNVPVFGEERLRNREQGKDEKLRKGKYLDAGKMLGD
jgi:hypothetical protein